MEFEDRGCIMNDAQYLLKPVGIVRSPLTSCEYCPKQGWEGAPDAWLEIYAPFTEGLDGIAVGSEILILTWLHAGRRDLLRVHPRGNLKEPLRGVFATRSPDRPNPIGLHRAEVLEILEPGRIRVKPLEAIDGTPIIDMKPVLPESEER
jgi:tRNA-Thr(GGU) m(6)t(6)A37 methyltransferase TsaA